MFSRIAEIRILSHDRYRLRLGSEQHTGTLYYLSIDPTASGHDGSAETGLARLFRSWITLLTAPAVSQPCWLPFDFADEITQWVACERSGRTVRTIFGWAPVEGWAISPSDTQSWTAARSVFVPNHAASAQSFYLPRLISELRSEIVRLCSPAADL